MEALRSFWIILAILPLHLQATCNVREPDGLNLACYCANIGDCNDAIEGCPDGCQDGMPRPVGDETYFDWRGPLCRTGNVAYQKPANQSGTHLTWTPQRAVDGLIPLSPGGSPYTCSHTGSNQVPYAWWSVDLEGIFAVHNITIYSRLDSRWSHRTGYFDIRFGNHSDFEKNQRCTSYASEVAAGGNVTLTCDFHLTGRYVSIQRTGGIEPNMLTLCEVVVMGYETTDCTGCKVECNARTGCMKCAHSYSPHCNLRSYGVNCACSCADHGCLGGYESCDRATGECPDGCEDWFLGPQCKLYVGQLNHTHQTALGVATPGAEKIKFTWRVVSIRSDLAQYYGFLMEYKTDGDPAFFPEFIPHHGNGNVQQNATVTGLISNTWYTFRLSGYRKLGSLYEVSSWRTPEVLAKTACKLPDVATDVKITQNIGENGSSFNVEWKVPSSGCESIISTHVLFRSVGTNEWVSQNVPEHRQTNTAVIKEIKEDHDLEIKIRVVNNEDLSSESQPYIAQLAGGRHLDPWRSSTIAIAVVSVISNVVSWSVLCYCQRCRCHRLDVPTVASHKADAESKQSSTEKKYEELAQTKPGSRAGRRDVVGMKTMSSSSSEPTYDVI